MPQDAHTRTTGEVPEPLYDTGVATPTHAEQARTLASRIKTGTLCTVGADPAGYPYGSFVTVALDGGHPVFLISEMAEHTKNLRADPRASVLIAEGGEDDPLARGRVTLIGECGPQAGDGGTAKAAFLKVHPNAGYYSNFKDFSFWKLEVQSIRYIGGYGRMSWVSCASFLAAEPDPLAVDADGIVAHMNEDHPDALVAYCHAYSKATAITEARMTSVDRYGFEMSAITEEGPRPVRLAFPSSVSSADEARRALIAMLRKTRSK